VLHAKDLLARWDWRHADGPMRVWVHGRYTHDGLIIHGLVVQQTYRRDTSWQSHLPNAREVLPVVVAQLREGLLNGDTIRITTPKGFPVIAAWHGLIKRFEPDHCIRGYRAEWSLQGRPKGHKNVRRRHASRLDPDLAQQAYALHRAGARWTDIARRLWPTTPIPGNPQGRNRLRARVNRLVYRGRLLADS
jgi:hypothetical protein